MVRLQNYEVPVIATLERKDAVKVFEGKIRGARFYPFVLSHEQITRLYLYERIQFMRWYERLWYWFKVTVRILT